MAEELKPCPFLSCGSKDVRWFSAPSFEDECESDYYVACAKCGASGPIRAKRKDAIAEWDARAEPERHVLGWINERPTKPGWYLRNNPAMLQPVLVSVFEVAGRLMVSGEPSRDLDRTHPSWWWYGPVSTPGMRIELEKEPADG